MVKVKSDPAGVVTESDSVTCFTMGVDDYSQKIDSIKVAYNEVNGIEAIRF